MTSNRNRPRLISGYMYHPCFTAGSVNFLTVAAFELLLELHSVFTAAAALVINFMEVHLIWRCDGASLPRRSDNQRNTAEIIKAPFLN